MWRNHKRDDHGQQGNEQPAKTSRRRFFKQGGRAAGVAAVFSLFGITPFSSARAASTSGTTVTPLDAAQAAHYVQAVLTSSDYDRFRQAVDQSIFTMQEQQIKTFEIAAKAEAFVVVYIPVTGGAGHSFYSAILQPESAVILTSRSGLFHPAAHGNVAVVAEQNGVKVIDAVLTPQGKFVQGTVIPAWAFWDCFSNCLSGAGVAGWLISLVGAFCGVVCIKHPNGPGCISCAVAVLGGFEFVVAFCAGYCVV